MGSIEREFGETDLILTPDEVAKLMKFSVKKIYRLCQAGEIPVRKIGGQYRFFKSEIEQWLRGDSND